MVCCHTPELLGWNQHGIGFSVLTVQPVSLILWIQWGVWLCIFGMRFLFLSLIILQRLLFGFNQGRVPPRSIYYSGCSLNPFLSPAAGLMWLCQAPQSSCLIYVAEKTVSSVGSGVPRALRLGILMYLWHLGGHLPQMSLSPCGYIINSAKKCHGLEAIPTLTLLQMWASKELWFLLYWLRKRVWNREVIWATFISWWWAAGGSWEGKQSWKREIHTNCHVFPHSSGPVRRPASRRGLPGKEGLLDLRFIHWWLKKPPNSVPYWQENLKSRQH